MIKLIASCLLLCHFTLGSEVGRDGEVENVVFVSVMYRHGNRTIVDPYPNDPYKNISFWPEGYGQLTKEGMKGHYELGKWLRRRYGSLLPNDYNLNDIHVQSTDVDRTLMSAYSNLAGLYQPDSANTWDPDILWRPVPVHAIPYKSDGMLSMGKRCPRYDFLLKKFKSSEWYLQLLKDNEFLIKTVSDATGKTIEDLLTAVLVYDSLLIESLNNFELPQWTRNVFPGPLKALTDVWFSIACHNQELARLRMGPILKEIVTNMLNKSTGTLSPDRKMFMYSAHDGTVANLLQGLGVFDACAPPYFSTVLIELRLINDEFFVSLLYKNTTEIAYSLTLPGCTTLCPIAKFVQLVQPIIPKDWENECKMSFLEDFASDGDVSMLTGATVVSFLMLVIASVYLIRRKPRVDGKEISYLRVSADST